MKPATQQGLTISGGTRGVLADLFAAQAGREFLFVEPGGNYGDDLIYAGGYKLARRAGLRFRRMPFAEFMGGTFARDFGVYIHGGGSYNALWPTTPMEVFRRAVRHRHRVVIQGPVTVTDDVAFLEAQITLLPAEAPDLDAVLLCRDLVSRAVMGRVVPPWVRVAADEDTSLSLTIDDLHPPPPRRDYTLYALRSDQEAGGARKRNPF